MDAEEVGVREAGALLAVGKERIHAMIRQGQLCAERRVSEVGTPYLVLKRADVERLAAERRAVVDGSEKKTKPGPKPKVTAGQKGGG